MPLLNYSIQNKLRLAILGVTIAAALGGCADGESRIEDAREATRISLPELPEQWASMQEQVGDVEVSWLEKLNDPVLSALVTEAQANNRSLQAMAANVDSAFAATPWPRAAFAEATVGGEAAGVGVGEVWAAME